MEVAAPIEGAEAPFFSPDGNSIGFFAERKLNWDEELNRLVPVAN